MKNKFFLLLSFSMAGLALAVLLPAVLGRAQAAPASTFTVDSNFDGLLAGDINPGDGSCLTLGNECTLRAAIEEANALPGADVIEFDRPMTITIDAAAGQLPTITDTLTIDGGSAWDYSNNIPGVTLDGNNQSIDGLFLNAGSSAIRGLYIHNFARSGIRLRGSANVVGGPVMENANVISGNGTGITLDAPGTQNNVAQGNIIGLTPLADAKEGNITGIFISNGASDNLIGGATQAEGNWIAGNTEDGVVIQGTGTNNNRLGANTIGHATGALGNTKNGILIQNDPAGTVIGGAAMTLAGNDISGNGISGIYVNWDAVNAAGAQIENNTITGNASSGITIWGANTQVISNIIRSNAAGGVSINGAYAAATGNKLSRNSIYDHAAPLYLGISLLNNGNNELAAPVIATVTGSGAAGTSGCASCTVEVFSDYADEGRFYAGSTTTDSNGAWNFSGALSGPYVTATVTDGNNNTSEFSTPKGLRLLYLPLIIKP